MTARVCHEAALTVTVSFFHFFFLLTSNKCSTHSKPRPPPPSSKFYQCVSVSPLDLLDGQATPIGWDESEQRSRTLFHWVTPSLNHHPLLLLFYFLRNPRILYLTPHLNWTFCLFFCICENKRAQEDRSTWRWRPYWDENVPFTIPPVLSDDWRFHLWVNLPFFLLPAAVESLMWERWPSRQSVVTFILKRLVCVVAKLKVQSTWEGLRWLRGCNGQRSAGRAAVTPAGTLQNHSLNSINEFCGVLIVWCKIIVLLLATVSVFVS